MFKFKKKLAGILGAIMAVSSFSIPTFAFDASDEGNYTVDASLSAYISSMGGIEFGEGLLTGVDIAVDGSGNAEATLYFTTAEVTIYSVTCDTFIDATDSEPGYYDESGEVVTAEYTISEDTALNSNSEAVNYVDSMTIPVSEDQSEYYLWLYINSNVMGVQFCDGNGNGASNTPGVATPYAATLTIDWNTLAEGSSDSTGGSGEGATETSSQSSTVVYNAAAQTNTYEVSIPATINVDTDTKTGAYSVTLDSISATDGSYVTVSSDSSGTLTNGSESLSFTNSLGSGSLSSAGDSLSGTVTVTDDASTAGEYTGTLNFSINFFAGN